MRILSLGLAAVLATVGSTASLAGDATYGAPPAGLAAPAAGRALSAPTKVSPGGERSTATTAGHGPAPVETAAAATAPPAAGPMMIEIWGMTPDAAVLRRKISPYLPSATTPS